MSATAGERPLAWLNQIVFWHWWVLAALLLLLELTSPAFFFLWLAFAASAVGFLLLAFPGIPGVTQLALFGALTLLAVMAWRRYRAARAARSAASAADAPGSSHPGSACAGSLYLGRLLTLDQPIAGGVGEIRVDDSTFRLQGPDLPAGARVRVIRAEGATLIVETAAQD